jgi:hypothetical protein
MANDEIFAHSYDVPADVLWKAVKEALSKLEGATVKSLVDEARRAGFSTGMTWTSWGEDMVAHVEAVTATRSLLHVTGHPHTSILTTRWGEELHQHAFSNSLKDAVERALQT